MTKYNPARDLPDFARELKTLSPTKLSAEVLKRRNEELSTQSVTMWFSRHPDVEEELRKELVGGLPTETQSVDASVFQNGSFQEIRSVKEWTQYLRAVRRIKEACIKDLVGCLRQICHGTLPRKNIDLVAEGKWCFKHPDRLSYSDAIEFLSLIRERNVEPYMYAKTLKSFLVSNGVVEGAKIVVGKHGSFGRLKELYVKEETLDAMLIWIRDNYGLEAHTVDLLMYKRAYRVGAVLKAKIENLSEEGRITLFEKGMERKFGKEGKAVTRSLKPYLVNALKLIANGKTEGPFFKVQEDEMAKINTAAIEQFCPEVIRKYGHVNPNHFWRHMYAQRNLRRCKWNLPLVAKWGNWTPQALEESYGGIPDEIAQEQGEFIND